MKKFAITLFFLFLTVESFVLINSNLVKDYIATPLFFIGCAGFLISLILLSVATVKRKGITNSTKEIKAKKVMVITIASLLIFNIMLFSFNNFVNLNITKDEIEESFLVDFDRFNSVAEYLIQQPGDIKCYIDDHQLKVVQMDENYNEMNIIIKDKVVKENLEYILNELKYKQIRKTENEVNYLLHPVHEINGFDDGIAYIKDGTTENTPLINQSYTKILDCWYYFFTGYV